MGRQFTPGQPKYKNATVRVTDDDRILPSAETTEGKFFRSKKEAVRFVYLRQLQARGEIAMLEPQVAFDLSGFAPDGEVVEVCRYVADFAYVRDGRYVVEDVKGFRTDEYKIKKKLMLLLRGIRILET